jgi:hypothetical protein
VSSSGCMECSRGRGREWRAANLEKTKEREGVRPQAPSRPTRKGPGETGAGGGPRTRTKSTILGQQAVKRAANKDKISKRQAAQRRAGRAGSELNGAGLVGACTTDTGLFLRGRPPWGIPDGVYSCEEVL